MRGSRTLLRRAGRAAELVSAGMLAMMFMLVLLGVIMRYGFGRSFAWTDEMVTVLFVWLVFWTGALVVPRREHVAFDIVYEMLAPQWRRALAVVGAVVTAGLFAWATPKIADFVLFLWRERTAVMQWRLDWVYACFALFVGMTALRFAAHGIALLRRGWHDVL